MCCFMLLFFFFKQKTAYEMRISDWSSACALPIYGRSDTCCLPRTTLYSYHRDSTDIEEWLVNTVLRAERIKRAVEMDYFPRTDNGCLTYNRQIGRASCRERVGQYV